MSPALRLKIWPEAAIFDRILKLGLCWGRRKVLGEFTFGLPALWQHKLDAQTLEHFLPGVVGGKDGEVGGDQGRRY